METFHKLARDWAKLDVSLDHLTTIDRNCMPGWMLHLTDEVLEWGLKALEENKYYRSDYKELLELTVVYLGGSVKGFRFRLPGPDHHARFMSKAIYWIKIKLLENSFSLPVDIKKKETEQGQKLKVTEMANYLALFYVRYWFKCPLTTMAARHDLELNCLYYKYSEINELLAENVGFELNENKELNM